MAHLGVFAVEGENVGLLRCDCALWNRGHDSVCAPPCGVHWMDGWVTGLAATADDGGEQWPDVDVGFMLARTLHTASCSPYVDRAKGAGGPAERSGGRSAVAVVCGWGGTAGQGCV